MCPHARNRCCGALTCDRHLQIIVFMLTVAPHVKTEIVLLSVDFGTLSDTEIHLFALEASLTDVGVNLSME